MKNQLFVQTPEALEIITIHALRLAVTHLQAHLHLTAILPCSYLDHLLIQARYCNLRFMKLLVFKYATSNPQF